MKSTDIDKATRELNFVEKAAQHFASHPEHATYTYSDIVPGNFLALRWGTGGDCVLVVQLAEDHVPTNYQQAVKKA